MGKKMGNIFKAGNVQFPIKLDSFQRKHGRESGLLLKKHFPEAAEEIKGITDATGYNNEIFTSWMMCMGCCLYNLEELNSVEVRGCTAFSFTHNGGVYYGRDNDLPLFLKKPSKSIYYKPEGRNSFILNTSSFVNGEEGVNEYGLIAAMTFVLPKLDEIKPGFNSVFLVRYILENCRTADEGAEALKKLPAASCCNILLADKSGKMMTAECSPVENNIRNPETKENGESFTITVNHFTSEKMQKYEAGGHNNYYSETRYQTAYKALKSIDFQDAVKHAGKILKGDYGFMCQYEKKLDFDTIWSSVFDLKNKTIFRAEGNPEKTKYIEDKRLKFI